MAKKPVFYRKSGEKPVINEDKEELVGLEDDVFAVVTILDSIKEQLFRSR